MNKIITMENKIIDEKKERLRKQKNEWYQRNKDKVKEKQVEYSKDYYYNNREKILEKLKEKREENGKKPVGRPRTRI